MQASKIQLLHIGHYNGFFILFAGVNQRIALVMGLATLGQYFNKLYSTASSLALMGSSTGVIICAPLVQFLTFGYGWRGALFIFGGICANIMVCGALMPCSTPEPIDNDMNDFDTQDEECKEKDRNVNSKTALIEKRKPSNNDKFGFFLFSNTKSLSLLGANFAAFFVWSGWLIYVVPHAEHKGLLAYRASSLATAGGVGNVLGKLTVPSLMDRKVFSPTTVLILGQLISGLSLVVDPLVTDFTALLILSGCFGFGFGVTSLSIFVQIKDISGSQNLPKALPWLILVGGIGRLLAAFFSGKYC